MNSSDVVPKPAFARRYDESDLLLALANNEPDKIAAILRSLSAVGIDTLRTLALLFDGGDEDDSHLQGRYPYRLELHPWKKGRPPFSPLGRAIADTYIFFAVRTLVRGDDPKFPNEQVKRSEAVKEVAKRRGVKKTTIEDSLKRSKNRSLRLKWD